MTLFKIIPIVFIALSSFFLDNLVIKRVISIVISNTTIILLFIFIFLLCKIFKIFVN